jgi:phospholipase/carboxylesterase
MEGTVDRSQWGRLSVSRPRSSPGEDGPAEPGTYELRVGDTGHALLRVPADAGRGPLPLVVALHGAGGHAPGMLTLLAEAADRRGVLVLAPQSTRTTWDVIQGQYGPDVRVLDEALARVFDEHAVDPAHLAVSGFSDGASYALSLGLTNGDLFTHVIAWSPGFASPREDHGHPGFFICHGTRDEVLSIDRCSRRLVPVLRDDGYDVTYEEFDDGHSVPATVVERALDWALS